MHNYLTMLEIRLPLGELVISKYEDAFGMLAIFCFLGAGYKSLFSLKIHQTIKYFICLLYI